MKKVFLSGIAAIAMVTGYTQTYPEPEFTNDVYYLQKNDTGYTIVRLEKSTSTMDTKKKLGGFGGSETEYTIDGSSAKVRVKTGATPSFVVSTGAGASKGSGSEHSDSVMRANGVDPNLIQQAMGGMMDPATRFTLYKAETGGGQRIILIQKSHAGPFASKKVQSSDKFSFSVKLIREGYWELIPDKSLPPGEYAFYALDPTGGSTRGPGAILYAFGVD